MEKEEAIKYLKRKGKYCNDSMTKEEKVEQVMKKGKIYGDPIADVDM